VSEEKEKKPRSYLTSAFLAIFTIAIVQWLWPGVIPFGSFDAWYVTGGLADWLGSAWWVLAWGVALQSLICIARWDDRLMRTSYAEVTPGEILKAGTIISLWAGVVEEIAFRWLIFYAQIVWVKVVNFLVFGFLGLGLACLFHVHIFGPIADFTTLGGLHGWLFHPAGWAVGAAMLATNAFFRDGHRYQGWFGMVDSWFFGMLMFWLMFSYGLPAAILIHFLYDFLVFAVAALFAAIRR